MLKKICRLFFPSPCPFTFTFTLTLVFTYTSPAQVEKVITLDSVTIEAVKRGFDANDFINWVQKDTTFYKAFKNLHYYPYKMESSLSVYDKKGKELGTLHRQATQKVNNKKRWIIINDENVSGKIYKKKKEYRYYTAGLFDHIFYPLDTLTASNSLTAHTSADRPGSKNEKNTEKLKTLIFNPGAEVGGVPFIGNRMAIFDESMTKHYDYKIVSDTFNNSIPCYVFLCKAKRDDGNKTDARAVIKELSTWFDKKTLNVVKRNYTMLYSSVFFDFNVTMDVNLQEINSALVPVIVSYNGVWDIPFRKPEIVKFSISFYDFQIN